MTTAAATNQGDINEAEDTVETQNEDAQEITTVDSESDIRTSVEDEIAERLRLQQEAENVAAGGESAETESEPEPAAESTKPDASVKDAKVTTTMATPEAQPEMVLVKVEGQQYAVPKSAIDEAGSVEAFQKRAAADLIFRRAKEREDAANKLLAQARQPAQQPQNNQNNQNQDASQQDPVAELVERVRFEADPVKAADAIRRLIGQQNTMTEAQVATVVQDRIAQNEAVTKFKADYPDIVKDPVLLGIASQMENQLLATGRRDHVNLLSEVGKSITEWKSKLNPVSNGALQSTPNATTNFDAKNAKKATITNIPQAKAKATLPEEKREPTTSEIIEEERKLRDRGR